MIFQQLVTFLLAGCVQATRERNFGRSSSQILHSGGITGLGR